MPFRRCKLGILCHGKDLAGPWLHGDQRLAYLVRVVVHRRNVLNLSLRGVLQLRIQRGGDGQTTLLEELQAILGGLSVRSVIENQVGHVLAEVFSTHCSGATVTVGADFQAELRLDGFAVRLSVDHALFQHVVQD